MRRQSLKSLVALSMLAPAMSSPAQSPAANPPSPASTSSSATITYGGGDGSSCDRAIIIQGAQGEQDGVRSEYDWLKSHYLGYQMNSQAEINKSGRKFDQLDFGDHDGKPHTVCFDITAYYGKP